MADPIRGASSTGRAVVVTPQSVNFFNDIAGRRLADALTRLGWQTRLTTLRDYDPGPADVAFLVSIVELFHACPDRDVALRQLDRVRADCPLAVMWLLEPANTRWFDDAYRLFEECGLDRLADTALHDQSAHLTAEQKRVYRHLFYGLTETEKARVRAAAFDDERRAIPWVFIGHKTPVRCETAWHLVRHVDPAGLLYLTDVVPITATGPHVQDEGYQRILRRCRYQLWRAHHSSFYMEGERFRRSALAGCVPVKIVAEDDPGDRAGLPFPYLLARPDELAGALAPERFAGLRARFLTEYLRRPSLEDEVARFLTALGVGRGAPGTAAAAA